jgi:hypothetical protein
MLSLIYYIKIKIMPRRNVSKRTSGVMLLLILLPSSHDIKPKAEEFGFSVSAGQGSDLNGQMSDSGVFMVEEYMFSLSRGNAFAGWR